MKKRTAVVFVAEVVTVVLSILCIVLGWSRGTSLAIAWVAAALLAFSALDLWVTRSRS